MPIFSIRGLNFPFMGFSCLGCQCDRTCIAWDFTIMPNFTAFLSVNFKLIYSQVICIGFIDPFKLHIRTEIGKHFGHTVEDNSLFNFNFSNGIMSCFYRSDIPDDVKNFILPDRNIPGFVITDTMRVSQLILIQNDFPCSQGLLNHFQTTICNILGEINFSYFFANEFFRRKHQLISQP